MRILHLINSLDPREGGTVECVRQIGSAMAAGGHAVSVVACGDAPDADWLASFPLEAHALGPGLGRFAYTRRLAPWLRRRGLDYDAWIIHGLWQYQGFGASRLARAMGIPYFVYAHGMLDPWQRRYAPMKHLKKLAYWMLSERSRLANAAGVLFTCEEERRRATQCFPFSRFREVVVGLGIAEPPKTTPADARGFRAAHGIDAGKDMMLFLGRLHWKKGIDRILRALAMLPEGGARPILAIAGAGETPYVDSLKALARTLRVDSLLRWTGPLYGEAKWHAFSAADLFVLPSRQENFGIALVESLAMGKPACTTRAVNIHPTLERHGAATICGDGIEDLAAALSRWISMNEAERRALGTRARKCYEDEFRVGPACDRLLEAMNGGLQPSPRDRAIAAA